MRITTISLASLLVLAAAGAHAASQPSCKLVSPGEIEAVLGFKVPEPSVTRNGPVTTCQYGNYGKTVLVRFETDESRSTFRADRAQFDAEGERTKSFTGFGLPAYSSVISGFITISTLVVLKGHTTLLVTAEAPLADVAKLVGKILPKI